MSDLADEASRDLKKQAKDAPETAKDPLENVNMEEEDPEGGPEM